jgi:hypothetical protein
LQNNPDSQHKHADDLSNALLSALIVIDLQQCLRYGSYGIHRELHCALCPA